MRALITGVSGFAGSHLAEHCVARGDVEVAGLVRSRARPGHAAGFVGRIRLLEADLRDAAVVERAVAAAQPDVVFHLAGQAAVPLAFEDPAGTLLDNAIGQLNLILAVLRRCPQARMLVVGSGAEYGLVHPDENPIHEGVPLRPIDPYAVSKVTQDLMAYQYAYTHRLQAVRVRPFNHTGPRQGDAFVASAFARQVAEIEAGVAEPDLAVGNLAAVRDFTDVRDMARAYFLAATQGEVGEVYNLGSGVGCRIEDVLGALARLSKVRFTIRQDPARFRPLDNPSLICDARKFRGRTGWEPEFPLERTLLDLLDYWRAVVAAQTAASPAP